MAFGSSLISTMNLVDNQFNIYQYTANSTTTNIIIEPIVNSGSSYSIDEIAITPDYFYDAVAIMKADYYPFGMQMPARLDANGKVIWGSWQTDNYRYGYNGMEKDKEFKGDGNALNYKWRCHDPRLGRFFQLDPLASIYPHNSPYAFCENSPIAFVELEGLEKASIQEIQAAKDYAKATLSADPNGTSKHFLGLTKEQLLNQINAHLNALEKNRDNTNATYWVCGPTAMIHVFLWFEPLEYVKAAISLYENGSTIINGKSITYIPPNDNGKNIDFYDGKLRVPSAKINQKKAFGGLDFMMIVSLRSSTNEIAPKAMNLSNNKHVGTLPWELDNMARILGIPVYHKNRFLFTNLKKIEKDISEGKLVVLLEDGAICGEKEKSVGVHYITLHDFKINRKNKTVTFTYWEHGKFNGGGLERNMTIWDFKRAVNAQYSFGNNSNNDKPIYDDGIYDKNDNNLPNDMT